MVEVRPFNKKSAASDISENRALLDFVRMLVKGIEPPAYALRVRQNLAITPLPVTVIHAATYARINPLRIPHYSADQP